MPFTSLNLSLFASLIHPSSQIRLIQRPLPTPISGLITELFRVNKLHADSQLDASRPYIYRPHEYASENAGSSVIRSRRPPFLTGSSLPKYGHFAPRFR
ncbi:hypothetical protein CDAR_126551 [Caerostris darwini]|uniref:Uncharacterized protein n=1 Tax=Caerostris darwini TaxID=1538125 RepID=A0AAV4RMN3_9ARAC|nr:hypothetical protein CDAR_126551 [Caerostris darwini]